MFQLTTTKKDLLTPLLIVAGAVDKKQSMPILANILLKLHNDKLSLTATDLEIEITAHIACKSTKDEGTITVPAKKFIDIIKSLEDDAEIVFTYEDNRVSISSATSKFKLTTLPADNYPIADYDCSELEFNLNTVDLIHLLQSTAFAMAQQDVRIYLNGLFLEFGAKSITAVTADGHRMAICSVPCVDLPSQHRLLIPKKGIQEVLRLLSNSETEQILISASQNHFRIVSSQYIFSSKLIEARFPPYTKAIPKNQDKHVTVDRDILKRALSRIIIMANEKSRAVSLNIQQGSLTLSATNQEHEEGVESLEVKTEGDALEIGLNAIYLLEVLNHMQDGLLNLSFASADSSILVQSLQDDNYQYIIMPMKI